MAMPIFVFALAMPTVRTKRPILAFCSAKTCSTRERIFAFALLAFRVAAGIGPPIALSRSGSVPEKHKTPKAARFFELSSWPAQPSRALIFTKRRCCFSRPLPQASEFGARCLAALCGLDTAAGVFEAC